MFRTLIREPLVHFIAAGLLIFLAHALLPAPRQADETIRIGASDIARLANLYAGETGKAPGRPELQALIADQVETTALAHEARRLGLDQGDTVVERRLAQKMRFMINDLAVPPAPGEAELKRWYASNRQAFQRPAETSFDHVFYRDPESPRAAAALQQLNSGRAADWRAVGDAFMLQRQYGALPEPDVERIFGRGFASSLAALEPGPGWQGPVASAFGVHLVRITARDPPASPPFGAVRDRVLAAWQEAELARLNAEAVQKIVSRYRVEIEGQAP